MANTSTIAPQGWVGNGDEKKCHQVICHLSKRLRSSSVELEISRGRILGCFHICGKRQNFKESDLAKRRYGKDIQK